MESKKKLWITLIVASVCIILLLSLVIFILSMVNPRVKMQGFVIRPDGTVQEEISFSIRAKHVRGSQKGEKTLELTFDLPPNFSHQVDTLKTTPLSGNNHPYYVLGGFCNSTAANSSHFAYCAYDKDAGLLIIDWNDGNAEYFVATTDPDVTAQEVLAYYKDFLKSIPKTK